MFSVLTALAKNIAILLIEALEISAVKGFSYLLCKVVVEIEIMNNSKSHSKRFLCLDKMSDVGTAVIAAGGTVTRH
jgi:hypothetical protein